MVAKGVDSLNQVLCESEILRFDNCRSVLEDVAHLECDSFDQPFRVVRQLRISWRRRPIFRTHFKYSLDLLESIDATSRITTQYLRDGQGHAVSAWFFGNGRLLLNCIDCRSGWLPIMFSIRRPRSWIIKYVIFAISLRRASK